MERFVENVRAILWANTKKKKMYIKGSTPKILLRTL